MLIAEELLLVAMDPDKGTLLHNPRQEVMLAAAGALVAELAFAGRVDLSGKRMLASEMPPDGTVLTAVQRSLAQPGSGRRAQSQLAYVDRSLDLWATLVDGLVAQNVLGRRLDRTLLWQVTRHPVLDLTARGQCLEQVWAVLLGTDPIDPRTATLVALAAECGVLKAIAPPRIERSQVKRRAREAAGVCPVTPMVHKAIEAVRSSS